MKKPERDAETHFKWAQDKFRRGDDRGAIADYDRTIELNPDDAEAYYYRGDVKYELGDYEGAEADRKLAIELEPEIEDR